MTIHNPNGPARQQGGGYGCIARQVAGYLLRVYEPVDNSERAGAITLIHGMIEEWTTWETLMARLAPAHTLYSVEMPWTGKQGGLWGLRTTPAQWIEQALALSPGGGGVCIAHSFGANALLDYCCTPGAALPRALVLISPFYKARHEEFTWPLFQFYVDNINTFIREGIRIKSNSRRISRGIMASMAGKVKDRFTVFGWLQFFNLFIRTPALDLGGLDIPCLVIAGEKDFSTRAGDLETLAQTLPNGRFHEIAGSGHFSFIEKPAAVHRAIDLFLSENPA